MSRQWLRYYLAAFILVISSSTAAPTAAAAEDEIDSLRKRIATLQATNAKLVAENTKLREQLKTYQTKVKVAEDKAQIAADKAKQAADKIQNALAEKEAFEKTQKRFYLKTETDPKSKLTTLSSDVTDMDMLTGATERNHQIQFSTSYKNKPAPTQNIDMKLSSFYTGKKYRSVKEITIQLDDAQITCDLSNYDYTFRNSTGRIKKSLNDEFATFAITPAALAKLVKTRSAAVTYGSATFRLTRDQLSTLRAFERELKK